MRSRGLAGEDFGVFTGEFFACDLTTFAGLISGGIREEGISEGAPSGSGVGQQDDDGR